MWDLVRRHEESGCTDFRIAYIDIDRLIASNIKQRIMDLVREGNHFIFDEVTEDEHAAVSTLCPDTTSETESVEQADFRPESVKSFLLEFSNVVTSTWVFRLIDDEMRRQSSSLPDKRFLFLVNLIPNRINLFKRCLFLNQTPNLYQFPFDFAALNLIRGNCQWKDLDLSECSFSDEVNIMFVKYFRSINKLVDIVSHNGQSEKNLKVKASNNQLDPSYKRVSCQADIIRVLRGHKFSHTLCLNVSDLPAADSLQNPALIFIVENKIDVDANTILEVDDTVRDAAKIKTLIDCLKKSRKVVDTEQKGQLSPCLSSPRSRLSFLSSSDK